MELDQLKALLSDYEKLKEAIYREKVFIYGEGLEKYFEICDNEYDIKLHAINDTSIRPNKVITMDSGTMQSPVTRIPVPYQKKIVELATTFLLGNPVTISAKPLNDTETNMLNMLTKVWNDNKLDYEGQKLAESVFRLTECAELWYAEEAPPDYWKGTPIEGSKTRLRYMLLSRLKGDALYPVFNSKGDMIAFGRQYTLRVNGEPEMHFDIYTDTQNYFSVKQTSTGAASGWDVKPEVNILGKIPVVYYYKKYTEWHDVQPMIDRYEKSVSNHGDNNDYFGSPMIVVKGAIKGFAKKGEAGKLLELENGAEAAYLESNTAPESIKLEQDNLKDLIHDMSDTPHISFEEVQGIGKLSGIALKLLFMGAHMKASKNETVIGLGFQRRLNFLKTALTKISVKLEPALAMSVKPVFDFFLPKDDEAYVNMLNVATGAKATLSQKTAVGLSPLVSDPDAELADILSEGLNDQQNAGL